MGSAAGGANGGGDGRAGAAARTLEVGAEQHGQRIDNFLQRELKGVPKSRIYRILRTGEVRVNKGRVKPGHRLQTGDAVRLPPLRLAERDAPARPPARLAAQLDAAILYQDDALLVLDKPAGLAVHKGSGLRFGLIEALRALRPDDGYLELAHRLDRDTSGCLLLARNAATLRELQQAFVTGRVQKRYLALARGRWTRGRCTIDRPLRRNALRGGERVVVVADDGKPALSRFAPLAVGDDASLLEVDIATGRTHQIRVHAADAGHPLAGDERYGNGAFNRRLARLGLDRLFLHAHSLRIRLDRRELDFSAPLPPPLGATLDALGLG